MAELVAEAPVERTNSPPQDNVDDQPVAAAIEENALVISNAEGKKVVKKIIKKKKRPARPQVDPAMFKTEPPPQTGMLAACAWSDQTTDSFRRNNLQHLV